MDQVHEKILTKIQHLNVEKGIGYLLIYGELQKAFPSVGDRMTNYLGDLKEQGFIHWHYNPDSSNKNWRAADSFPVQITTAGKEFLERPKTQRWIEKFEKTSFGKNLKPILSFISRYKIYAFIGVLISLVATIGFGKTSGNQNTYGAQSPIVQGDKNNISYTTTKDPNYLNQRDSSLLGLLPEEIAEKFYTFQNDNKFRFACSLLKKIKCDASDGEKVNIFSRERGTYLNGYEDLAVFQPKRSEASNNILCTKYSYELRNYSPGKITEIMRLHIDRREDGEYEITSKACEKKFIEGMGERPCPILSKEKYCL